MVPQTRSLRIVGIVTDDPDSLRGMGRARVFIPLDFAQGLQMMLPSDLRDNGGLADRSYGELTVRVRKPSDVPALRMQSTTWA